VEQVDEKVAHGAGDLPGLGDNSVNETMDEPVHPPVVGTAKTMSTHKMQAAHRPSVQPGTAPSFGNRTTLTPLTLTMAAGIAQAMLT
jgi:hypothetical protein